MELSTLWLFIPACFALNAFPGPNNLMAMTHGQRYGLRYAVLAGLGRLVAFVLMIALAAYGLAVILYTSELFFLALKVAGALYLFWLAYQMWTSEVAAMPDAEPARPVGQLDGARREFLIAAGNPKAILIFTAFFPQFVDTSAPVPAQFAVLGAVFLLMEWLVIAGYGVCGKLLQSWFTQPLRQRLFNRGCAGALACAGAGLLASQNR
ncbi:LysE family translocator [Marinobacter sp. JSM 1782161]|uniref:LysE family translocator n=1 Tax=Marinobacter sp. JSM 1782161 TaxID=2685906 RepID=UPI001403D68F|nr:LysE family translocator [Marinobacter sp. JSM 1782161]